MDGSVDGWAEGKGEAAAHLGVAGAQRLAQDRHEPVVPNLARDGERSRAVVLGHVGARARVEQQLQRGCLPRRTGNMSSVKQSPRVTTGTSGHGCESVTHAPTHTFRGPASALRPLPLSGYLPRRDRPEDGACVGAISVEPWLVDLRARLDESVQDGGGHDVAQAHAEGHVTLLDGRRGRQYAHLARTIAWVLTTQEGAAACRLWASGLQGCRLQHTGLQAVARTTAP